MRRWPTRSAAGLALQFADDILFVQTAIDDDPIDALAGQFLIRQGFQAGQTIGRGAITGLAAGL
jgi:hypothetical protein